MSDRRIHGRTANGTLIVRYERAGKWYAEGNDRPRQPIAFKRAVELATKEGSYVYLGLPGGTRFDAKVREVASR